MGPGRRYDQKHATISWGLKWHQQFVSDIVKLANEAGLENVNVDDMEELFQSHDESLTINNLRELAEQHTQSGAEDPNAEKPRKHQREISPKNSSVTSSPRSRKSWTSLPRIIMTGSAAARQREVFST